MPPTSSLLFAVRNEIGGMFHEHDCPGISISDIATTELREHVIEGQVVITVGADATLSLLEASAVARGKMQRRSPVERSRLMALDARLSIVL